MLQESCSNFAVLPLCCFVKRLKHHVPSAFMAALMTLPGTCTDLVPILLDLIHSKWWNMLYFLTVRFLPEVRLGMSRESRGRAWSAPLNPIFSPTASMSPGSRYSPVGPCHLLSTHWPSPGVHVPPTGVHGASQLFLLSHPSDIVRVSCVLLQTQITYGSGRFGNYWWFTPTHL